VKYCKLSARFQVDSLVAGEKQRHDYDAQDARNERDDIGGILGQRTNPQVQNQLSKKNSDQRKKQGRFNMGPYGHSTSFHFDRQNIPGYYMLVAGQRNANKTAQGNLAPF
jgi:hypothetical protein